MRFKSGAKANLLSRFISGMNLLGAGWVLFLVVLINFDAFGRSFLNKPLAGAVEIVAISMTMIVFCQLVDTIRLGKLTRSDGYIQGWLDGGRSGGRWIVAGFELLGVVVMSLITFGTLPLMIKAYERGQYIGTRGVFHFPEWPIKAMIVFGSLVAALAFLRRAVRILRGRLAEDGLGERVPMQESQP